MGKVENKSSKPSFAKRKIVAITLVITIMLSFAAISPSKVSAYQYPHQDPGLTVDQRMADLLHRRTIDEKIGQMLQVERLTATPTDVQFSGEMVDKTNNTTYGDISGSTVIV